MFGIHDTLAFELSQILQASCWRNQKAQSGILDKLITLTIEEVEMYPSIQAKIWGNIGQVSELIDLVLDSFIKRSVTGGLGSAQAEIMAETAVSLSAANVALVARKVIWRLCRVIGKFTNFYYELGH